MICLEFADVKLLWRRAITSSRKHARRCQVWPAAAAERASRGTVEHQRSGTPAVAIEQQNATGHLGDETAQVFPAAT
jgi:hypothetical protein